MIYIYIYNMYTDPGKHHFFISKSAMASMASMAFETREGDQDLIAKISAASEQDDDDDQARWATAVEADAQMEKDVEYPTKTTLLAGFECAWLHRDYTKWSYEHWRYPGLTRKASEKAPLSPGLSSENDSWEPWNMLSFWGLESYI